LSFFSSERIKTADDQQPTNSQPASCANFKDFIRLNNFAAIKTIVKSTFNIPMFFAACLAKLFCLMKHQSQ